MLKTPVAENKTLLLLVMLLGHDFCNVPVCFLFPDEKKEKKFLTP